MDFGPRDVMPYVADSNYLRDARAGTPDFPGLASYPAPEQGFHGSLVAHHDLESYSTDWGQEFGPRGPSSACAICKAPAHRHEWWCRHHAADVCDGSEASPKVSFGVSVDTAAVTL